MRSLTKRQQDALVKAAAEDAAKPVHCDECGLGYDVDKYGCPLTQDPYTCDDCGGYVPELPLSRRSKG